MKVYISFTFKVALNNVKVNYVRTKEYSNSVPNQADRLLNSRESNHSLVENGFNRLPNCKDAVECFLCQLMRITNDKKYCKKIKFLFLKKMEKTK